MITSFTSKNAGPGAVQLSWASDQPTPTFRLYRDGRLVISTSKTSYIAAIPTGSSPVFEVLDDPTAVPSPVFPDYVLLAWYASPATDSYKVEQFVGSAWVQKASVTDTGAGYFTWRSATLLDSTTYQFRVTPIGANGNAGTAKTFNFLMVFHPAPPSVAYGFNTGASTVTIVAA